MTRLLLAAVVAAGSLFAQKPVMGTLTDFRAKSLEFVLRSDSGETVRFHVGPETAVVRVPPGEHDLTKAAPMAVTDLAIGDRLLLSFVAGMSEPRRIVRIPAGDIERRNEAETLDWQRRGISGIVAAKSADEVKLEQRTMQGSRTLTVAVTPKTVIRRYAPDSVKFSDAVPSGIAEIAIGDQLRARGDANAEGSRITADDIVFGTFLTSLGPITAIHREAGEVQIRDSQTNALLTIRITADSRLKKMPDMHEMFGAMMKGGKPAAATEPGGMAQMLDRLPAGTLDDLKVGSNIVVTATRGTRGDTVTAIMLVANIDGLIQMAQMQSGEKGLSPTQAISRMHHGMMEGPGGSLSLPALIP